MKLNLTIKKAFLPLFLGMSVSLTSIAQFNGTIEFKKVVGKIEVSYKYFVSGDNIRVEEINENGNIDGIQIMDLKKETIVALSPERKMYMDVPNKRPSTELDVKIDKTGKSKTIMGMKCNEIVVTAEGKDRRIVYWVTDGDYNFFIPMLKTLNRKENQAMFYLQIPGMEGKFPVLSQEYAISTGALVSELSTVSVKKGTVDNGMFKIPSDYSKFER
jgi:hypothetical protein